MICLCAAVAALGVVATANTSESNANATHAHLQETCVTTTEATTHVESEGFGRCLKSGCTVRILKVVVRHAATVATLSTSTINQPMG